MNEGKRMRKPTTEDPREYVKKMFPDEPIKAEMTIGRLLIVMTAFHSVTFEPARKRSK